MTPDERARLFLLLARYIGTDVTARFLQRTGEEHPEWGVPHLHSLQEGIYKPAGSTYALTVKSRSALGAEPEAYPDRIVRRSDGGWTLLYPAKQGSLDNAVNRSLFACQRDRVPVLVIATSRPKEASGGVLYRILGPAFIERFDPESRRFELLGCVPSLATSLAPVATPEEQETTYLRQRLALPLVVAEPRAEYVVSRAARDQAFRDLVLEEYFRLCAVCKSRFVLHQPDREVVEAEAAHIIPVAAQGPDDPRNALSLCRRHHWAFDEGLFTITDTLEVRISPAVKRAEKQKFDLEEYSGESLVRPAHTACVPGEEALAWHRRVKFLSG